MPPSGAGLRDLTRFNKFHVSPRDKESSYQGMDGESERVIIDLYAQQGDKERPYERQRRFRPDQGLWNDHYPLHPK